MPADPMATDAGGRRKPFPFVVGCIRSGAPIRPTASAARRTTP
ncbi:MAG: hypothetical protein ACXVKQ_11970 [Acidimicrobiia bacterium]